MANKTPAQTVEAIAALRRLRMSSPQIAEVLDRPLSTICAVLKRLGLNRLGRLGLEPAQRYEHELPGGLIHTDIKKLGRIQGGAGKKITGRHGTNGSPSRTDDNGKRRRMIGWDYVHIAIDDATRLAYTEVLADEKATRPSSASCAGPSLSTPATASKFSGCLTDNGSGYRSTVHAIACRTLGIRHLAHPALPPPDQWQSRALHPHHARRLGLRRDLPIKSGTHPSP